MVNTQRKLYLFVFLLFVLLVPSVASAQNCVLSDEVVYGHVNQTQCDTVRNFYDTGGAVSCPAGANGGDTISYASINNASMCLESACDSTFPYAYEFRYCMPTADPNFFNVSFSADKNTITTSGEAVELSYDVSGATGVAWFNCSIRDHTNNVNLFPTAPSFFGVSLPTALAGPSGTMTVNPTDSTVYGLWCMRGSDLGHGTINWAVGITHHIIDTTVVTLSGSTPECSDGSDNDSDGFTDFPADPDCTDANDDDETGPGPSNNCSLGGELSVDAGTGVTTHFSDSYAGVLGGMPVYDYATESANCEAACNAANALYCDFDFFETTDEITVEGVLQMSCRSYTGGAGLVFDADDWRFEGEAGGIQTLLEEHDADYCGPNATLSVNPGTYPYPNTAIGASVNPTHTFWVTNTGGGTLSGSVSIPAGAFSCTGGCSYNNLTSASAPHAVTIEFDPSAVTSYSETAVFSSDAGPNVNVSLSGDGVADPDPDPIVAFWSNDPTINLGDSSELEWDNVSGGGGIPDDCTIEDLTSGTTWGPGAPISPEDFGTYDVTPATTRDYRLRCENNGGASSDQAEVTVTVNLPTSAPLIAEDGANTRRISDLQNYDLTNAIDPEGDDIRYGVDWDSDDIVDEWVPAAGYAPSGSALVATRDWNVGVASGVGTKNVQVKAEDDQGASSPWSPVITFDILNPLPNIILTVAPPSPLFSGDATNVSWTATDATTCQTLETVPAGGWDGGPTNHGLPPGNQDTNGLTLDTDFPVECTGAGGTVSATATIRVLPGIGNFTHTPEPVVEGGDITLNWDPVVGSNVSCEGRRNFGSAIGWDGTARSSAGGADTLGGVFVDSQYELRCENTAITPQTWAAEQTDVTVAFPIVSTFEALPQQVLKGKQSQIVWNVANLEGLYIYRQASSEAASTSVHTNEVFPVTEDNSGVPHDTIPIDEPVTYTLVGAPLIGPHIIETFTITPFVPGFIEQ